MTMAVPVLPVSDLEISIAFYRDRFGFQLGYQEGGVYAIVHRNGAEIHLSQDSSGRTGRAYVFCSGIDELAAQFQEVGLSLELEVKTQGYGIREFIVYDLDGNRIGFGEVLGVSSESSVAGGLD